MKIERYTHTLRAASAVCRAFTSAAFACQSTASTRWQSLPFGSSIPSGQGRWVCFVVVVVVDVDGGGVVLVDCSVVVVRLTGGGPPQPASNTVPAISAMPTTRLKRNVVSIIA